MKSFPEVLAEAIDDLVEHGFDSIERIEKWTRELRLAAEHSLITAASLEQMLRDGLTAMYRRAVDQGGIFRHHAGISRFTRERVRPALRAELDRRIMASASLIRLNREQAIDQTLRRFQGWSTSIPRGGAPAETRREVKATVRKSLAQLPFEQRRVLIDQGHKLTAALSEIISRDGGAIAGVWRSHWRQAGYNYRPDHRDRDARVYLVRDSWAHRAGLVRRGEAGYVDEITAPAQEPFCRCYYTWLYNVRDLPDDMVTQKGRRAGVEVGMGDYNAAFARADSVEMAPWRSPGPVPIVDRDHDVQWMAVISRDGRRLYVDRTLPREVEIRGRTVDPAEILWAHEFAEWLRLLELVAAFLEKFLRHPDEAERIALYYRAHEDAGIPAERAAAERLDIDWAAWEAWSRGELARLEHRKIISPPPDPHVKPAPHDRREPMEAVA